MNVNIAQVLSPKRKDLEDNGLLDINNETDMFCLHYVLLPRVKKLVKEFAFAHNNHALRTEGLVPEQEVWIQDHRTKEWQQGTIRRKCQEPQAYVVETENGNWLRRNRRHIRPTTEPELGRVSEAQVGEEPGQSEVSMRQTNNEQEQKNTATDACYRTRSGRVIRKPERYGQ